MNHFFNTTLATMAATCTNDDDLCIDESAIKLIYLVKQTTNNRNPNVINVSTDEGKAELNELVYHTLGKGMIMFVIKYEHTQPIVVRDILMHVNKEKFKGNVENEEYVRLLQSFMIIYDYMLDTVTGGNPSPKNR